LQGACALPRIVRSGHRMASRVPARSGYPKANGSSLSNGSGAHSGSPRELPKAPASLGRKAGEQAGGSTTSASDAAKRVLAASAAAAKRSVRPGTNDASVRAAASLKSPASAKATADSRASTAASGASSSGSSRSSGKTDGGARAKGASTAPAPRSGKPTSASTTGRSGVDATAKSHSRPAGVAEKPKAASATPCQPATAPEESSQTGQELALDTTGATVGNPGELGTSGPSTSSQSRAQDDQGNGHTQKAMAVTIDHLALPGEVGLQESDLLDRMPMPEMPEGERVADEGTSHIPLVSLGCFCGPKLSFKRLGRGSETLPFDWIRTRIDGVLHFIRNDFEGFYDFVTRAPVPDAGNMVMFRNHNHSFWHDDPTDPCMRERYDRRFRRFFAIDTTDNPTLFVRAAATSSELEYAGELAQELQSRFGLGAHLLMMLDFQVRAEGPGIVEGIPNLLVYYLSSDIHTDSAGAPYTTPVLAGLDWVAGRPIKAMKFPGLEQVIACADETEWGLNGLGGHLAFEDAQDESEIPGAPCGCGSCPRLLSSELLERGSTVQQVVQSGGIQIVSLGSGCDPKLALQEMGRGGDALPFDWMRVRHEGLLHFLSSNFAGFFDYRSRRSVPGTPWTMYRSKLHSFWHDDPDSPSTREAYRRRMDRFKKLGEETSALLFVRTVAAAGELARVGELLEALGLRFGHQACLLVIAPGIAEHFGPHVVQGLDDLLVHFVPSAPEGPGPACCREAIDGALDWLRGEPLEAGEVASPAALCRLSQESGWALSAKGTLRQFE